MQILIIPFIYDLANSRCSRTQGSTIFARSAQGGLFDGTDGRSRSHVFYNKREMLREDTNRELIKKNRRGRARGREAVKNNEFVRDSRSGSLSEQPRPSN